MVPAILLASACGSGDDGSGAVSTDACHRQCEAQEEIRPECRPLVDLATCKILCDQIAATLDPSCADEFDTYYNCSADAGFMCLLGLPAQPSGTCAQEEANFTSCSGAGTSCAGENERGLCPRVICPCPSGATPVSGFESVGTGCRCFDETTCVDFFCD